MDTTILAIAALLPPLVFLGILLRTDKVEREPLWLVALTFGFGALSCIPAAILEVGASAFLVTLVGDTGITFVLLDNFLGVALIEEGVKLMAVRAKAWNSPEFDYRFDGVIYGGAAALGFAALENVLYVMEGGIELAATRAVTSIPGHMIFGIIMGFFLGMAKYCKYKGENTAKWAYLVLALLVPTLLHGFYDYALSIDSDLFMMLFFIFIVVLDVVAVILVRHQSKHGAVPIDISGRSQTAFSSQPYGNQHYVAPDYTQVVATSQQQVPQGQVYGVPYSQPGQKGAWVPTGKPHQPWKWNKDAVPNVRIEGKPCYLPPYLWR